ncbi:MAG: hypothetical protein JSW71_23835 [Gemmatimonadota bacterium]|nr:MAG: hypothetical protein JSW71_23835 [Gemmatimonadota bacterium]
MKEALKAKLEAVWRLMFPRKVLSRRIFVAWAVTFVLYAVLLLTTTGVGLLRLFLSPDVALVEKIVALMLAPPVVVVLGLGLGAMLLTVAFSVWVDICVRWASDTGSRNESD